LRAIPGLAVAALFLAPVLIFATDEGVGPSLGSILAAGGERRVGPETLAQGPGAIFAALSGVDTPGVNCASPIVAALARTTELPASPLRAVYASIAARPILETGRTALSRDGHFTIHYSDSSRPSGVRALDDDRNGLPDTVDRIAEALTASRSFLVTHLGYPDPAPDGQRLDVVLLDLGHGLEGYAVPMGAAPSGAGQGTAAFIVLDAGLSGDRIMAATMHQVAHASLALFSARTAPWWSEATAGFLTLMATGDLKGAEAGLQARLQSPGRGLAADDLLLMQGSLLWPLFLSERVSDPSAVRQIAEAAGSLGLDPLAAADLVMKRTFGLTLSELFREYTIWNLFTGSRDDRRHYSIGRQLPDTALQAVGPDRPVSLGPPEAIEPLGSAAFRVPGDQSRGALDLQIRAEAGDPGVDLIVLCRSEVNGPVLVPVPLTASGSGRRSIPWADVVEAWVILRNGPLSRSAARFEVTGTHDDYAPFDLASFTAEGSGASMTLQWTTASEKGLIGWNVYRSETPTGPFTRLNSVAVPAPGDGSSETGYIFIDDAVRPDRRYYYQIEGYGDLGLAARSPVVSARIPPPR